MTLARRGEELAPDDLVGLIRDLEASDRFVKDSRLGRVLHPGRKKISYREAVRENSLHIVIEGNRIDAHVDTISPLVFKADGTVRYSLGRAFRYSLVHVLVHNLSTVAETLWRLLSGKWNEHRCELVCERVEIADGDVEVCLDTPDADASQEAPDGPPTTSEEQAVPRTPFNVVDEAVDLLDTQATPWSIQLEVRVAARLDEDRLRAALHEALRRHPRGRARKAATSRSRRYPEWEIGKDVDVDPLDVVDCPDERALAATRAQLQSAGVPLTAAPPVRARLARSPAGDVLMLNLHHVATDGFGGVRLLHSIARAYRGVPDPLPDHDPSGDRTLPVRLAEVELPRRMRRLLALAERLRDLPAPPARLARTPALAGRGEDPGYGFHHVELDRHETQRLTSHGRWGSVNDALLAALHLAVDRWNAAHGAPCRRVTVLVPSNLRPPRWRQEVMGNFSLPARIGTGVRQRTSPAAALGAVATQTSRKKRSGIGTALLQLLEFSHPLPLRVKQAVVAAFDRVGTRFVDTAVLSNLGSIDDPPSFGQDAGETTEVWFSAPSRLPLGLSVGALTVAGRLRLVFRYDTRVLDAAAARAFADDYLEQLGHVIDVREGTAQRMPHRPVAAAS